MHRSFMSSMTSLHVLVCVSILVTWSRGVSGDCKITDKQCEFHLSIDHRFMMMKGTDAVFPEGGKLYKYDVTNTSSATPVDPIDVIQGDGHETQRMVTVANGTMPGPAIEVYEGQTVIVHVTNHLLNEAVTIHWHGLHQKGTPFMDGVAFITQCPVHPGQSFTYKFKAEPKGTFWYHSHMGVQRTNGFFGAFIIHEKEPEIEEHIMQLQDWNHDDSLVVMMKMLWGGFEDRKKLQTTKALDGSFFSRFFMTSGLINGKGRLYDKTGHHNEAPLTVFDVTQGQQYRFRVIAAGHLYPFRVCVDQHELTIVASDGYDLQPKTAESFIINPGERVDFLLNATEAVGNYWVRAQTLEVGVDHKAEAILRYAGAPMEDPQTMKRSCIPTDPCVVINCPFSVWPVANTECLRFDQLKSLADDPAPSVVQGKFKEHFLNFAFPGLSVWPGQVNGHAFKKPSVSGLTQFDEITTTCDKKDCGEDKTCYCTYMVDLHFQDTIQMVIMNIGQGEGWNHPVHLHGHSFYVLKMGYAQYNETTGKFIADNEDIDCGNTTHNFCNDASWSNKTWYGDDIPGLELVNPPRKDTLIVPTGGYAVIRIKADNPGFWFMHCHIEMHNADGMAVVINEARSHIPAPPKDFPSCTPFGPEVVYEIPDDNDSDGDGNTEGHKEEKMFTENIFWTVVGCLIGLCVLQFLIIFCMCCRRCEGSGREKWTPAEHPPPQVNQAFEKY